jgi:hypothetical protein
VKIIFPKPNCSHEVLKRSVYILSEKYITTLSEFPESFEIIVDWSPGSGYDEQSVEKHVRGIVANEQFRESLSRNTMELKELIVARALFGATHVSHEIFEDEFDDPEGIAIPWEEKYGDS